MLKQTLFSWALAVPLAQAAWTGVTKTSWDWYVIKASIPMFPWCFLETHRK